MKMDENPMRTFQSGHSMSKYSNFPSDITAKKDCDWKMVGLFTISRLKAHKMTI